MAPHIGAAYALSQERPALADQPVAVDFIDNRLPAYHPALRNLPPFNPVLRKFSATPEGNMQNKASTPDPRPLWDGLFPVALSRLQAIREQKETQSSKFRIRDGSNWCDVQDRLQAAQVAYMQTMGIQGWVKRTRRVLADKSQVGLQMSKFVPTADMTSPVVSIVQSVLEVSIEIHQHMSYSNGKQVVQNASKVRQCILESFNDVDKTIAKVEQSLTLLPLDSDVREHAIDLTVTILSTVEQVVVFYEKGITRKAFSALFRGEEYENEVLQGLTSIETKGKELSEQLDRSYKMYSRQQRSKADRLNRDTNNIAQMIDSRTGTMEGQLEHLTNAFLHFLDDYERGKREEWAAMKRQMDQLLAQTVRSITPTPTPEPVSITAWQLPGAGPPVQSQIMMPEDLWKMMHINDEIEKIDLDIAQDKQAALPSRERGKAGQIVSKAEFRSWITSTGPKALLVHGHGTTLGGVSALSMLSTILTRTLRQRQNFLAITHFCGIHEDEDEPYHGGVAMMRSFVSQLLCQQKFNTNGIQYSVDLAAAKLGQVAAICQTFGWLISQLSEETTLICIIDEIGCYERDAAIDETLEVMSYISQLMRSPVTRATIKIFATSTIVVREMREFFPESVLDLSSVSSSGILSSDGLQRELEAE
ncbi:hypothetical protein E8E13_008651 [Curvularia kusanoi]|uniref:Nephrocystin 3-like N-terminal domain-containing protein n=1 Tax=Curvularia kusanoi TaxID=90978 RepID=A0A9P4WCF7_CURKU|nr:hypothetical protein E8E13_008651 [Curvularia kusanoi]